MVLLRSSFKQILHLGAGAVIVDDHIESQAPEALEKGLGVFVCAIPDAHTCDFIEVLVVYDDALAHLVKIHVVLVRRHLVPGGLG